MTIWVYSICYNSAELIPFYLRHYGLIADRMMLWDDKSTDGTRELLKAHSKVVLHDWPHDNGISEDEFLAHAYAEYPKAKCDWVMWVDMDEFIYHPQLYAVLAVEQMRGTEVVQTQGFNMSAPGFPKDDGKSQIWELVKMGVRAPVYSKPVVFRPTAKVRWSRGKHTVEHTVCLSEQSLLKLLHYRYLGYEYTRQRNARNYARCNYRTGDKNAAWTCAPDYHGEHSADWAENELRAKAWNVIEAP